MPSMKRSQISASTALFNHATAAGRAAAAQLSLTSSHVLKRRWRTPLDQWRSAGASPALGSTTRSRQRSRSYTRYTASRSEAKWLEFTQLRSACNRLTRKKQEEGWHEFLDEVNTARHEDPKQMWNLIKRLIPDSKKASITPIAKADGSLALSEDEIVEAWAAHVERLGTPRAHPPERAAFAAAVEAEVRQHEQERGQPSEVLDRPFDVEELEEVVDATDYHKACAKDRTQNTMFKKGKGSMLPLLCTLFNHLRETESIPDDWRKALIVNLYKDGPRTDPGNYRGIALISCLGKLYLSVGETTHPALR